MTGAKGAFPDIRVMHKGKITIQDTRLNIENAARKKKKRQKNIIIGSEKLKEVHTVVNSVSTGRSLQ